MIEQKPLPSGTELPPSFDLKIWDLENDIKILKETALLKDEEKIFDEMLSGYGGLDEKLQKELQAFKFLVDGKVAENIDILTSIDGHVSLKTSDDHHNAFISLTPPVGRGKFVLRDDIAAKLKNEGVCYGIKWDAIDRLLKIHTDEKKEITDEIIAEGRGSNPERMEGLNCFLKRAVEKLQTITPFPRRMSIRAYPKARYWPGSCHRPKGHRARTS